MGRDALQQKGFSLFPVISIYIETCPFTASGFLREKQSLSREEIYIDKLTDLGHKADKLTFSSLIKLGEKTVF